MSELTPEQIERSMIFRRLENAGRERLLAEAEAVSFRAGDTIFGEGNEADAVYLIRSGSVRVLTNTPEGPFELAVLGPGAFFGEVGVLKVQPRMASVYAVEAVQALRFPVPIVREILNANPKARQMLEAVVAARAQDTIDKLGGS